MIRRVLIAVVCVAAASATVLGAFAYGAASKYPSTPWLAGLQWNIPYMTFEDCQKQSFPALRKEGLDHQYKGPSRSWYGRGPGGVAATIFCYKGPNEDVWVTIVSAHESFDPAARMSKALLKRLHGTGSFEGEWDSKYGFMSMTQDGNNVTGTYAGSGCGPGKVSGTTSVVDNKPVLSGTWTSDDPSICTTPDDGPFQFTLVSGNRFEGTWSYSNGSGGGDWWGERRI